MGTTDRSQGGDSWLEVHVDADASLAESLAPLAIGLSRASASMDGMATTSSTIPTRELSSSTARASKNIAVTVQHALAQVIPANTPCALIDHPDHPNVGDSAIWLGERLFMRGNHNRVAYSCSIRTFDEATLRRAMPEGIILIHGGGNFGTLWPHHHRLRERVIELFRDYRVVQLPQSIRYEDDAALARTADLIAAHPDFHLLVRDANSLAIARDQLGAKTSLSPDAALMLEGQLHRATPVVDVLVLARTDKERAVADLQQVAQGSRLSVETADWLEEPTGLLHRVRNRLRHAARRSFASSALFQHAMLAVWDRLADQRTQRGCRLLSRGRVVVTDRLHAHILSTMLGIPHVVLDNNYGKLSSFIDAWTADHPLVHRAASTAEAMKIAEQLVRR